MTEERKTVVIGYIIYDDGTKEEVVRQVCPCGESEPLEKSVTQQTILKLDFLQRTCRKPIDWHVSVQWDPPLRTQDILP